MKESLRKAGVPAVKAVWVSEAGCGRMWVVTSIEQKYAGHATQAANLAVQCQAGGMMNRYSVVVDDDIDPTNEAQVIWAISTLGDFPPKVEPSAALLDATRRKWASLFD